MIAPRELSPAELAGYREWHQANRNELPAMYWAVLGSTLSHIAAQDAEIAGLNEQAARICAANTDMMNDLVLIGLARDDYHTETVGLKAEIKRLRAVVAEARAYVAAVDASDDMDSESSRVLDNIDDALAPAAEGKS